MHTCIHVFSILSFRDDIKLKFVALVTFRCLHEAMTSYDVKKTQLVLENFIPDKLKYRKKHHSEY